MATTTTRPRREGTGGRFPQILNLSARRVRYETPRVYFEGREQRTASEAVEISVETDRPFPMMAIPPVIFVGEVPILEYGSVGRNRYRFFAPDFERLAEGAPISVGFPHSPRRRVATRFRYRLEGPAPPGPPAPQGPPRVASRAPRRA